MGTSMVLIIPIMILVYKKIKLIQDHKINSSYSKLSLSILKITMATLLFSLIADALITYMIYNINIKTDKYNLKYYI